MCDSGIENSHPKSLGTKKFRCKDQIIQLSECIEWMKAIFDKRMNVIYENIRRNIFHFCKQLTVFSGKFKSIAE